MFSLNENSKRLRVLYLLPELRNYGGAEIALTNLVNHMDSTRFEIWVGGLFATGKLIDRLHLPEDHVISFNFHWDYYHYDFAAFFNLIRFLRTNHIQIVHSHLPQANTLGRIAACIARVPVVVATEQNTYIHKSSRAILADRVLALCTTQLIAISKAVASYAAQQAGIPINRYTVIPNGIALEEVQLLSHEETRRKRAELGIGPEKPVVISVGRLVEQKSFPVLLRAAHRVLENHPEAVFLVVGSGPMENELRNLAISLGVHNNLKFLGLCTDIYELLQISNLFVLPSQWEGQGVVLLEAGACKLPVVASRVGGIPEVVEHGRSGLLVPPNDDQALADAIHYMLNNPELQRRMGEEGQRIVKERFSAETIANETADLYRMLWDR